MSLNPTLTFPKVPLEPVKKVTSVSATRPVNPPGVSPVLTEAQLWAGVEFKLRNIHIFAPNAIEECIVLEDNGNDLLRQIKFTGDHPMRITEPMRFWPCTAARGYFPDGADISDAISYGPNDELWFTITCAGVIPDSIPSEGLSAKEIARRGGDDIEMVLEKIRELVRDGTIKA